MHILLWSMYLMQAGHLYIQLVGLYCDFSFQDYLAMVDVSQLEG